MATDKNLKISYLFKSREPNNLIFLKNLASKAEIKKKLLKPIVRN